MLRAVRIAKDIGLDVFDVDAVFVLADQPVGRRRLVRDKGRPDGTASQGSVPNVGLQA